MIDKEKYPKLHKTIGNKINMRTDWLREAIRAQLLCETLPEEVKGLEITDVDYSPFSHALSLTVSNTNGTIQTLKTLGIQGLKPQVSSWSKKHFFSEGKGVLPDGTTFTIYVSNIEEPEGCIIEEKRSWSTNYVLVCEQSGKEI